MPGDCFILPQARRRPRIRRRGAGSTAYSGSGLLSVLFHNGAAKVGDGRHNSKKFIARPSASTTRRSRKALRPVSCTDLPPSRRHWRKGTAPDTVADRVIYRDERGSPMNRVDYSIDYQRRYSRLGAFESVAMGLGWEKQIPSKLESTPEKRIDAF